MYGQQAVPQASGLIGGAAQGAQNMPSRMTQVQEQMEIAAKLTACIEEKLKSLYSRLQSVLISGETTSRIEEANKTPQPVLVGHASALSNHNAQLNQIDQVLAVILDRLEL